MLLFVMERGDGARGGCVGIRGRGGVLGEGGCWSSFLLGEETHGGLLDLSIERAAVAVVPKV